MKNNTNKPLVQAFVKIKLMLSNFIMKVYQFTHMLIYFIKFIYTNIHTKVGRHTYTVTHTHQHYICHWSMPGFNNWKCLLFVQLLIKSSLFIDFIGQLTSHHKTWTVELLLPVTHQSQSPSFPCGFKLSAYPVSQCCFDWALNIYWFGLAWTIIGGWETVSL